MHYHNNVLAVGVVLVEIILTKIIIIIIVVVVVIVINIISIIIIVIIIFHYTFISRCFITLCERYKFLHLTKERGWLWIRSRGGLFPISSIESRPHRKTPLSPISCRVPQLEDYLHRYTGNNRCNFI